MSLAPDRARPRPDLGFLRHRRRPSTSNPVIAEFIASHSPRPGGDPARRPAAPAASQARPAAPRPDGDPARRPAAAPRTAPPTTAPLRPAVPTSRSATSLDLDAPTAPPSGGSTSPDLDAPAAPPSGGSTSPDLDAPAAPPSGGSTSPDLGGPPAPARGGSTSLDLDAPPAPAQGGSTSLDLDAPASAASSTLLDLGAPAGAPSAPPAPSTSLDLGAPVSRPPAPPGSSTSLDLGAPASRPPAPPGSSTSLDLGGAPTTASPRTASPGSTSLDLGGAPTTRPAAPRPAERPGAPLWVPVRAGNHLATVLQPAAPEVVLDRRQSAVGTLTIDAVVGADVGDLRLGAAYQLASGLTSTVAHASGRRFAPPSERQRPVVLASRGPGERLEIDLRQVRELERLVVFAFPGDGAPLQWGGTLRLTTFGGARVEIPLDQPPSAVVTVVAAIYRVGGELVVRAERDLAGRTIREACRAYGFDRISWLDDSNPAD